MRHAILTAFLTLALPFAASAESGDSEIAQIDAKADTFTAKQNGQMRTYRVRPGVEVTINGIKATFAELEAGMKVKVTSAEPGLATRLAATGLRTIAPSAPANTPATPKRPPVSTPSQPVRQEKATIPANSPDAFPIGDVRKGTKLSLQYLSGKWKCEGRIAQYSPDDMDPKFSENNRLVISLPSADGKPGDILAIVPGNTAKKPFVFEADKDYPGVVLRIHDYNGLGGNPGSAEYNLKVLPPAR